MSYFIVFDGPEGAGKTTQIKQTAQWLAEAGVPHLVTREPGGCPAAERIRSLVLGGEPGDLGSAAELLLFTAARVEHLRQTVHPALVDGKTVLCDRFLPSTLAYQAIAGGTSIPAALTLHQAFCGGIIPDLTILFALDPALAAVRRVLRGTSDRMEAKGAAYHQRVAEGYRAWFDVSGARERTLELEASGAVEEVAERVRAGLLAALPRLMSPVTTQSPASGR